MTSSAATKGVAIVTGAANGIGWATAQRWTQEGYRVALLDLNLEAVQARATELGHSHISTTGRYLHLISPQFHPPKDIDPLDLLAGLPLL